MLVAHKAQLLKEYCFVYLQSPAWQTNRPRPHFFAIISYFLVAVTDQWVDLDVSTGPKLARRNGRTPAQKEKGKEKRREKRRAPYAIPKAQQEESHQAVAERQVILVEPVEPIGPVEPGIFDRRLLTRTGEPVLFERPVIFHPSPNDRQVEPAPDQVEELLIVDEVEFIFQ